MKIQIIALFVIAALLISTFSIAYAENEIIDESVAHDEQAETETTEAIDNETETPEIIDNGSEESTTPEDETIGIAPPSIDESENITELDYSTQIDYSEMFIHLITLQTASLACLLAGFIMMIIVFFSLRWF